MNQKQSLGVWGFPVIHNSEVVDWCLFSTRKVINGATVRMTFFDSVESYFEGNVNQGILYGNQAFMIKRIRIFGLRTSMFKGMFRLVVYPKVYDDRPAFLHSIRERFQPAMHPPLILPPNRELRVTLEWPEPVVFDSGFRDATIQICLLGQLLRPVN